MDSLVRKFSESFAQQTKIRVQMAATGFRLENGFVSAEFFKAGRSLGVAEALKPGDKIYEIDFDKVELLATPGVAWAGDVKFYLTTGKIESDRIVDQVSVYKAWFDSMSKKGGRITWTATNPTPATKRAGVSIRTSPESGSYPSLYSKLTVLTGVYVSRPSRMWSAPMNAGLTAIVDPCPGAVEYSWNLLGGVGFVPYPPNVLAVSLDAEFRRGEWVPAVPDGAMVLPVGWMEFEPRIVLLPGNVLVVQSEDAGDLRVMFSAHSEGYRS